ncbi:chemotaxis protein CheW (plasmid) [Deinococcus sp. D7000]|nr:chemotaxis protein CheW [Deinococcus sp. D7000]
MSQSLTSQTFLLFRSGARLLALPTRVVRQVVPVGALSPLPATGGSLLGLAPAQGRAVPVVNLAALLGVGRPAPQADGSQLGLLCESAGEPLLLPIDDVIGNVNAEVQEGQALLQDAQFGEHPASLLSLTALSVAVGGRLQSV